MEMQQFRKVRSCYTIFARWTKLYANSFTSRSLSLFLFQQRKQRAAHIHVKAESDQAKFWLDPISLAANYGFRAHELNEIERIIQEHKDELLEAWNERPG